MIFEVRLKLSFCPAETGKRAEARFLVYTFSLILKSLKHQSAFGYQSSRI